jgi:hypothetical protein
MRGLLRRRFVTTSSDGAVYFTSERQLRESSKLSSSEKLQDMVMLGSAWHDFAVLRAGQNKGREDVWQVAARAARSCGTDFNPVVFAMEVQDLVESVGIECVISGSVGMAVSTQARMTMDVDLNVRTTDHALLKGLFERHGHELGTWGPFGSTQAASGFSEEQVCVAILRYKGIDMDVFFNTCTATELVHQEAIVVQGRKFISPECSAHFKLYGMNPRNKKLFRDKDDLRMLARVENIDLKHVRDRAVKVFGADSMQVREWDDVVRMVELEEDNEVKP